MSLPFRFSLIPTQQRECLYIYFMGLRSMVPANLISLVAVFDSKSEPSKGLPLGVTLFNLLSTIFNKDGPFLFCFYLVVTVYKLDELGNRIKVTYFIRCSDTYRYLVIDAFQDLNPRFHSAVLYYSYTDMLSHYGADAEIVMQMGTCSLTAYDGFIASACPR